jgi:hypothetical protein
MNWTDLLTYIILHAGAVSMLASAIAAFFPKPTAGSVYSKLMSVVNILAVNVANATNAK